LPVLLLFVGLAIDFGAAYLTKTTLSKAVDAAALAGMRSLNQGTARATTIAKAAFTANYPTGPRDANPPAVNIVFGADASNNTVVNVNATATINTFFLGVLSGYHTLTVSSNAQATRPKLIMSLVLDRSGSMNLNGGAQALPPAVDNFLTYFDNNTDQVADVSFSSIATVDVTIRTNFQTIISNAVNRMPFGGATFSQAGMLDGQAQINSVPVSAGENVVKVAVFFTDGWANTINNTLNCPPMMSVNFGGCSPPEAAVGWCGGISFMNPLNGNGVGCGATSFPSQLTGGNLPLTPTSTGQMNIANDAMFRTITVANSMRTQNIVIYSIGLGDKISQAFLQQVANDPASPTYNPNEPVGQAVFAPTAADLQSVFQTIAAEILLRLSQ
ncbi:MAG TPA: pilus assembly protein, partial [Candidatus Binataceae bacterium]|nr:pilus assembly protein [Candidatus Binataceae bacterium]